MSPRTLPLALATFSLVSAALFAPLAGAASPVNLAAPNGAVVFTFDAGYVQDLNVSASLASHGFRGTFYVISDFLHQGPYYTAFMSAQDLANLTTQGHDIESETKTHPDLTTLTDAQLASELADSQAALQVYTGRTVAHVAYPFDAHDARVETATAARYTSGRGLTTDPSAFLNADAYRLPALVITSSTTLATAESYVDFAIANHVTVILSFQNITPTPGAWDWTPTQLDALLAYTQGKGVPVKTVAGLFAPATPTPPGAPALTASAGNAAVTLTWTTPSNGGSAILGYNVTRGTIAGGETAYRALNVTTSFVDSNVTNGNTYYYKVAARNAVGTGNASNEATAKPVASAKAPGVIIFGFDDGQADQVAAAQTLVDHGMRGTFYIVSNCANSEVDVDCMTQSQVQALSAAGHDIESHTVLHHDLTTLTATQLTNELANSKTTLQAWTGKPVLHLAYPYGSQNANVQTQSAKYYSTARIYLTNPAPSSLPTLIAQSGTNKMVVPGIGVVQATTLARAEQYVDYAIANNITMELTFHDILTSGGDSYSWSPANLRALEDYVVAKNVTVKTVAQAYP